MNRGRLFSAMLLVSLSMPLALGARQEPKPQPVTIRAERVSAGITCFSGGGGNVAVLEAGDGLLLVDAKMVAAAADLQAAIRKVSQLPVRILVNTHHHHDHVGGNHLLGQGARIIAQQNCLAAQLAALAPGQTAAEAGAPTETYARELRFSFGGEPVRLIHFGPGHTAGDTVLVFERAKVLMTGDLVFLGMPPYIDVAAGADTENWIRTLKTLAERYPDFRVIPGHGPLAGMKELGAFAAYLGYLRAQVGAAIRAGKTRAQTVDSVDMSRYLHLQEQGNFMTRRNNVGWVYDELSRRK